MTQLSTKAQQQRIHMLAKQNNKEENDLRKMIAAITHQRTESTKQMTCYHAKALIAYLEDKLDRKRKRVIANLKTTGMSMDEIHAWVLQQKHKKHLNEHTSQELSQLIYAAEKVKNHYYSKI